ncbi:hypothetical protein [Vibrio phage vB_VpS_PG28]|nr:hypothetical protein [Vibrio phage vB_VpS_PG28]
MSNGHEFHTVMDYDIVQLTAMIQLCTNRIKRERAVSMSLMRVASVGDDKNFKQVLSELKD